MNPHALPPSLQELVAAGRLVTESIAPLGGNRDRRDTTRSTWKALLADGSAVKLTCGTALGPLAERQRAFARACPSLVPHVIFLSSTPHGDVLAEEFFPGRPLSELAADDMRAAFAQVCATLTNTERRSDDTARRNEWEAWTTQILALPVWRAGERIALADRVLLCLFTALTTAPATTRWTNGDFLAANVLADESDQARVVDCEFAHATHFWREDAVRFHALSPIARQHPDRFTSALPDAGPAWHLYFWLRQWSLEHAHNSAEYLARVRDIRLATVRRLSEHLLGAPLSDWSAPAAPVHFHLEAANWSAHDSRTVEFRGWCHVPASPLRAIVLCAGETRIAEAPLTPRPDVQTHLGGTKDALLSGFTLSGRMPDADGGLSLAALTGDGVLLPFRRVHASELAGRVAAIGNYSAWAALHDPNPAAPQNFPEGPLFSILLPVFRTPEPLLRACIASVRAQHYPRWELCLVDDGSGSAELTELLEHFAAEDARIRLLPRPANGGIARATNDALAAARGEFITLLDHDDELRPHALLEMARTIQREPNVDLLYSDEDKIDEAGRRIVPFLKPDFSPEFLLGVMYFGHLLCVRTDLARRAGGFDPAFDGVQDFEFALRVTQHTRKVVHVPAILYHWRQTAASSALHGNVKGDMDARQAAAVQAHLQRVGRTERVVPLGGHRVRLDPTTAPSIALVVGEPSDLHAAATRETAEVLLLVAPNISLPETAAQIRLATAAMRPDAGFVAPLLVSADRRVLDAGWIVSEGKFVPLLRGFDAGGDGMNGTLRCTREATGVSSACVAVRREHLLALAATTATRWPEMLTALSRAGHYHRVVASVHVVAPPTWHLVPASCTPASQAEHFYNPRFDARLADYSLREDWPAELPLWHLDTPIPEAVGDGCLHWRGWCHWPGRALREVRLQISTEYSWSATFGLPRPDVAAQLGTPAAHESGFEARLRLPEGDYEILAFAVTACGREHRLFAHRTRVTRWARARYSVGAAPERLLAFQFLAGVSQLPTPLPTPRVPAAAFTSPRFAIVTPSYQQAAFLERCLRSVLSQPGVSCDYVVQDGGSTDGSREIIAAHAERLHAWTSERDAGQADAIARGFARTTGATDDVMAWLNSDDAYLPGALATVADFFARHPQVDVVYGHRCVIDEHDRWIGSWIMPPHDDEVLRLNDFVPQETLFWRRRIWDRVGGIDRSLQFALDWDLLLRFQAAGARMVRLPVMLGCFRVHSRQKTSAAMHHVGQAEIDWLRTRTHGRFVPPTELNTNPRLIRYLQAAARLAWRADLFGS